MQGESARYNRRPITADVRRGKVGRKSRAAQNLVNSEQFYKTSDTNSYDQFKTFSKQMSIDKRPSLFFDTHSYMNDQHETVTLCSSLNPYSNLQQISNIVNSKAHRLRVKSVQRQNLKINDQNMYEQIKIKLDSDPLAANARNTKLEDLKLKLNNI